MTSLATLLPRLAPQEEVQPTVAAFTQHDILTDVDLHFTPHVPLHRDLPPDQVNRFRDQIATNLCAVSSTGNELLRQSRDRKGKQRERFSTSLEPLDDFLDGGIDQGEIVQITGPRRSGRTALALYTLLLHLLLHPDARGAWFDSTGTFDPHRCLAILRDVLVPRLLQLGGTFAEEGQEEPTPEQLAIAVLDRLAVSRVTKSGEVLDVLSNEVNAEGKAGELKMVVIDSLDNLLGGEALQKGAAQAHASLIVFMRRLTLLARSPSASLAILVITTVPSAASGSTPARGGDTHSGVPPMSSLPYHPPPKPALVETFAHQVDLSLLITSAAPLFGPEDGKDRGFVEVIKSTRSQEGGLVAFQLINGTALAALE
ncbi:hypothetical protein JCM10908_003145 [Rhodotorula pacifica]|uniref:uncharacterized protein n=1 Tax=Rhodotorula pacifica TaxID=1495444 RepID=UPI003182338C